VKPFDVSWAGLDSWALYAVGCSLAFLVSFFLAPVAIRKLRGARIVGRDRHKPGMPEVAEMGGLIVFAGFMAGVFALLMLARLDSGQESLILAALITASGAGLTGVLDDMIALRQRFKAILPLGFAIPLALFVSNTAVTFPLLGRVEFGWLYPVFLVPLGITCAANGFNMLEGFNGLGAGLGIILAAAIGFLAATRGDPLGLVILAPLAGALLAFLNSNWYPAQAFPGDTMTLLVGASLGAAAILGKVEFWGLLLFVPHVVEFFLKAKGNFNVQSFASRVEQGRLHHEGKTRSLTHLAMGRRGATERTLVLRLWGMESLLACLVVALAAWR
jgi:UDP-N-acetylglucosamine--dolichyl-phosphate N-acetylglucosaminephosphotransferase